MTKDYRAFIFDLNGTMIDDMQYHIRAWHGILNGLGANLSLERVKEECYGKNSELLERIFPGRFSDAEKSRMGLEKEQEYQLRFRPYLRLLDGLPELLERARHRGIKTAIGSAAIRYNIDFVLDGTHTRSYFDAVVSADDVVHSKPDGETFLKCARAVQVAPDQCLVFEDAPKGVAAARNAGMDCLVLTTLHRPDEFADPSHVISYVSDYNDPLVKALV